ncbi:MULTISPECIES: FAD-dependent monooxygenase [unclassified Wenzhouxiangella]|uniref:FAD-dependent monooxygenase n=1 Tax=unclassified Wenzhouxiangella TaxID=2613841 RepID=UPI000E32C1E0|nr:MULTISPECIES: FAD-dependent monooxygenase [unclassified Wenzhouxiangella]RFF26615.1 FAD-binding protein [Wenzhouxiangella sp. 15181]RFP67635.1 FAD-binding protein [Wenzhouxiangella sp. 15190]
MSDFDVIIVGGGLAGSALAIGLAQAGSRVALVEAFEPKAQSRPSFDDRTLVVNAASLNILSNLGILDDRLTTCALKRIEISRAGAPGHLSLRAEEHGCERFGAVIVARELGAAMLRRLEALGTIESLCPERLAAIDADDEHIEVELESGKRLRGQLLVGSDGTNSTVRRLAGIDSTRHDYGQSAMIFNVHCPGRQADTAWERFTPVGPLALLPQPDERLGVVWIDRNERIESALALDDEALLERLESRSGRAAGGFVSPGKRVSYPLALTRTPCPLGRRVVLVGNAANTIHPVSAQGFNLGLRDVAALVDHAGASDDPGHDDVLSAWLADRQSDQAATVRYTDTLARAFSNPSSIMRLGTGLGLFAHAAVPAMSGRLVRAAMGFREPVSSLAAEVRR